MVLLSMDRCDMMPKTGWDATVACDAASRSRSGRALVLRRRRASRSSSIMSGDVGCAAHHRDAPSTAIEQEETRAGHTTRHGAYVLSTARYTAKRPRWTA